MSNYSSVSSGKEGNTISSLPLANKQISAAIRWCFTLNNYTTKDISSIVLIIQQTCKFGIIGQETGECELFKIPAGTPHLQGYIEFTKKARPLGLFKRGIHWEKAKGNKQQNVTYCSKEDNVCFTLGMPKPIKVIEELYDWQKRVIQLYHEEPDDRKIHWFWESPGGRGKSCFIKYMYVKYKILFCQGGKHGDIMNLVFNQDMDACKCVVFDIPRANKGYISYASLESIKNGMVCNTKYETGVKVFNSPHVFVFANFPPDDESLLSKDRWVITEL